jgi:hypothetical protein
MKHNVSSFEVGIGGYQGHPPEHNADYAADTAAATGELKWSSGRAKQPHDGACSIHQRQDAREHQQAESYRFACEVMMRFAREIITAESVERRFAIVNLEN